MTREIPAIAAQEHAHVNLVFLALETTEETIDTFVIVLPFDDEAPLLIGQIVPRHVEPQIGVTSDPFELSQATAVVRLAPRLNRAVGDRFRRVGHDEIHVELDDVADAVTGGTRAERIVEGKQPRLRNFVRNAARPAFESLAVAP